MRSLRSRVIEDSNTSTSTTSNVEEANNIEQPEKKRKSKMIKTKKSKKRTSEVNENEHQGNFVLLRNRKRMTVGESYENCEDHSTNTQRTINDNDGARKTRNAKRKKKKSKQSINEDDFCPTFESAITSTTVKPKKEIKFFYTSPVNNTLSAKEKSPNEQQIKRQKKGRRKQKMSENSVKNKSDVLMDTQNEHKFVRAPKHDVTNNTNILIDNTTFDADKSSETVNESLKNKSVSLRKRKSDVLVVSNRHDTFDKTNDKCINIDNTTFDSEIRKSSTKTKALIANESANNTCAKINKSKFDTTNNKTPIRANAFILDIHNNDDENRESNNSTFELSGNTKIAQSVSTVKNNTTDQECSKINNGTFDVDDSILTKSRKIVSIALNKKVDQEHSAIDNGTFEMESSLKRKRSSVLINRSTHEECSKIDDGTFEVEENTKSQNKVKSEHVDFVFGNVDNEELNRSSFKVNKTPYNHRKSKLNLSSSIHQTIQDDDVESSDDETTPVSEHISKKSIFENLSNGKVYVNLDDISDVELDDVINISDDTPIKLDVKQKVFNVSKEESTVRKSVNVEKKENSDTFDMPVCNQSGEWQVEDLTKSITEESYVDRTQFGTDTTFAVNNEPFSYNLTAKNFMLPNETNNVLTPSSTRKKWQKFARNSNAANFVLEQINASAHTPSIVKSTKLRQYSSPFPAKDELSRKSFARNKSLLASSSKLINKEPKSVNKNTSISKQEISKGVVKRTAMPNFALIHQKAFEKMESLQEYSERKRQRAKLLLSSDKIQMNNTGKVLENKENVKKKSSRELFTDNTSKEHNRFGFKVKNISVKKQSPIVKKKMENTNAATMFFKSTNIPKPKLIIPKSMMPQDGGMLSKKEKAPIFQRKDVLAIANKNKGENLMKNRDNRRDQLKGVRTNRRFELLMKMRQNQ